LRILLAIQKPKIRSKPEYRACSRRSIKDFIAQSVHDLRVNAVRILPEKNLAPRNSPGRFGVYPIDNLGGIATVPRSAKCCSPEVQMSKVTGLAICCTGIGLALIAAAIARPQAQTAQNLPPLSSEYAPGTVPNGGGSLPFGMFRAIAGKPFQAEYNSRRLMPGLDGMRFQEFHGIFARDSRGRILSETIYPHSDDVKSTGRQGDHFFSVFDSVTHESISWDDGPAKLVMKMTSRGGIPTAAPLSPCMTGHTGTSPQRARGQSSTVEDLGEQKMEGVTVHGCRVTNLVTQSANPDFPVPYSVVDETWAAPDLAVAILHTHTDRDTVDLIERLDNIVQAEPDIAMFTPPDNFRVYDQEADMAKAREMEKTYEVPLGENEPSPILLGGPWEAADPIVPGARVGFHLYLNAQRDVLLNGRNIVARGAGTYSQFSGTFFQRATGRAQEEGFIVLAPGVSSPSAGLTWGGQHLKGAFKPRGRGQTNFSDPEFGIDLTFDRTQQVWVGDYTRRGITKQIKFERPGTSAPVDPFAGVWARPTSAELSHTMEPAGGCVQISRSVDGVYTAWTSGEGAAFQQGAEPSPPPFSSVFAGFKWGITVRNGTITLDEAEFLGAIAGGIPPTFSGKLSADGNQIVGNYVSPRAIPAETDSHAIPLVMTRVSSETCYAHQAVPTSPRAFRGR
jgi:hypothetical protein